GLTYVKVDPFLLLSAVQLHDKDVAIEVTRLRAAGLMLRNSAPQLLLGLVAAVIELIVNSDRLPIVVGCGVLLAAGSVSLIAQGRRLGHWAHLKTLELCFWLPDVEERFRADGDQDGTQHSNAQR
ncbi:MAG: hypothetical protein M3443_16710, partial [Actinomycetota bacterium]|nr:hypothetical protein [Actinomycetota bacterium]